MQPLPSKSAPVSISKDPVADLNELIDKISPDKVFLLTDEHTQDLCLPLIEGVKGVTDSQSITIKAGDHYKNTGALASVWQMLSDGGASRHSLLINLGGGMPCDLGGFAAATYKRGIPFINLPTTLLSMVDASVGGKTGINFNGFKNEIGAFRIAEMVLIHTPFLNTLDKDNLLSGYAEMLKHALIDAPETLEKLLITEPDNISAEFLAELVADSVMVKDRYVEADPLEKNIRKALNLGHTIGHAFESLAMKKKRPALHGYAVAWGLIPELKLAVAKEKFPMEIAKKTENYINQLYGHHHFTTDDFDALFSLMQHDKKNKGDRINFTLLSNVGTPVIDIHCSREEIKSAIFD
ncbi:3-dehydroquinate synthase family protein [Marinilabilia salmonicolor]|jgi:3-dehydroquinate synthase|uniref:3-dehydroquinate synthase n=1 Tax=Marinilabilia salmonicolor TaxID=989 RepID=A0A368V782_9BACT|nr:3-dehydroquinate synthase family protein [Marinilabilia salmonicolor]RCW36663.1 3-dehydroquinate synthase [Marinilabilia salmonicolor]